MTSQNGCTHSLILPLSLHTVGFGHNRMPSSPGRGPCPVIRVMLTVRAELDTPLALQLRLKS